MDEKDLIKKAKNGDSYALEQLYEVNFNSLYRFIRFKVNTNEDAEDICSESFIRAFSNIKKFREKSSFKTYVYTIAKNLIIDYYKETNKTLPLNDDVVSDDNNLGKSKSVTKEIKEIFSKLDKKESEILELRYLTNLSVKETAIVLNLSESNVKVIAHRAIEKAKKFFMKNN
ncbi:MAG: RNA polymerase sigma factor [Ignavibacteriae bacterium]|nr:RNA polymerase sigma factor [Ignavibacteriota bacterium]